MYKTMIRIFSLASLALSLLVAANFALASQVDLGPPLSGDQTDACNALICLSAAASKRPGECNSAISRYYSIKRKKFSATLNARRNFLRMCPDADSDPTLSNMVSLFTRGAGYCDAAELNKMKLWEGTGDGLIFLGISDKMPDYCLSMYEIFAPDYYRTDIPIYIGVMGIDGHWVDQ